MKSIKVIALSILVIFAAGCAFAPQSANLNPAVNVTTTNIGKNRTVHIEVVDDRATKSLGRRGSGYGPAASITAGGDLSVIIREELTKGLQAKGFKVVERKKSARNDLKIEIRNLKYTTSQGLFTTGIHVASAFKVYAKNRKSSIDKMYRFQKDKNAFFVPRASTNEKWINQVLSNTLEKILSDEELLTHLSK